MSDTDSRDVSFWVHNIWRQLQAVAASAGNALNVNLVTAGNRPATLTLWCWPPSVSAGQPNHSMRRSRGGRTSKMGVTDALLCGILLVALVQFAHSTETGRRMWRDALLKLRRLFNVR